MAFLIPAYAQGIGSGYLAAFLSGGVGDVLLKGPHPSFGAAFMYGVGSNLVGQGAVFLAKQVQKEYQLGKNETVVLTVAVIAFQVFSSYSVANQLRKSLDVVVPRTFIHVENALFIGSVLEIDFELTAKQINEEVWKDVTDMRPFSRLWAFLQMIYQEMQNGLMQ